MLENVQQELNKFAKAVVKQSRANLTRAKKGGGSLYKSLDSNVKVSKNSFELTFLMEEYGIFQDKGVKGKDPSKVSPNAKIKGQQAPNSKYKFGSGKTGNYKGFVTSIEKWAKKKNIRLREFKTVNGKKVSTGRFAKGSYKTISHIIAGNIYNRGIRPSLFFTKPFEQAFKNLDKDIVKAFALDVETLMKNSINNK
jgi:hypothetical protein